jgi:hypothetical protein
MKFVLTWPMLILMLGNPCLPVSPSLGAVHHSSPRARRVPGVWDGVAEGAHLEGEAQQEAQPLEEQHDAFDDLCLPIGGPIVCDYIRDTAGQSGETPVDYFTRLVAAPLASNSTVGMPECAWRSTYEQLRHTAVFQGPSTAAWNLAFPDQNSIYHVSIVYFNEGDELLIRGPSLPYTRYWSLQTYDKQAGSLGSIQDYAARTEYNSGPNAFNNKTAGEEGDAMGSYDVRITAHGDKYQGEAGRYINELPALHSHETEGFFFLFLRLYDPEVFPENSATPKNKVDPIKEQCYGSGLNYTDVAALAESRKWGWVCPPTMKRTNSNGGLMSVVPFCETERADHVFTDYEQGGVPNKRCMLRPNSRDNLFLPANDNLNGEFRNKDANYLLGCAEQPTNRGGEEGDGDETTLWARLSAVLPDSADGLYSAPYVGEPKDYEVRYISVSSVNRSPPSVVYRTLKDEEIFEAMKQKHKHTDFTREYTIWFGPDEESMPEMAKLENAIFLPWPREMHINATTGETVLGELVPYPGILYREILSQGQMFDHDDCDYHESVGDILRDKCDWNWEGKVQPEEEMAFLELGRKRGLRAYCYDETCCGDRPPECCRDRRHIKSIMREHYPSVDFYKQDRRGGGLVKLE